MDTPTRLLQEKAARDKRRQVADTAIMAMSEEERRGFIADWLLRLESGNSKSSKTKGAKRYEDKPAPAPASRTRGGTYVDNAERVVLDHADGIRTVDVGTAIGQDVKNVDGTLRQAARRQTIFYDKATRKWYPVSAKHKVKADGAKGPPPKPKRVYIRDLVYQVYATERRPLTAMEVYHGIQKLKLDINRTSVDGEINRMKKDHLLVQVGVGANNAGLYNVTSGANGVATGGTQTAATK